MADIKAGLSKVTGTIKAHPAISVCILAVILAGVYYLTKGKLASVASSISTPADTSVNNDPLGIAGGSTGEGASADSGLPALGGSDIFSIPDISSYSPSQSFPDVSSGSGLPPATSDNAAWLAAASSYTPAQVALANPTSPINQFIQGGLGALPVNNPSTMDSR